MVNSLFSTVVRKDQSISKHVMSEKELVHNRCS